VKASFLKETEGTQFKSMLPTDQHPPADLNAATMAKWRDQMKAFYVKEKPRFQ
jgi:hypothetical protein